MDRDKGAKWWTFYPLYLLKKSNTTVYGNLHFPPLPTTFFIPYPWTESNICRNNVFKYNIFVEFSSKLFLCDCLQRLGISTQNVNEKYLQKICYKQKFLKFLIFLTLSRQSIFSETVVVVLKGFLNIVSIDCQSCHYVMTSTRTVSPSV